MNREVIDLQVFEQVACTQVTHHPVFGHGAASQPVDHRIISATTMNKGRIHFFILVANGGVQMKPEFNIREGGY